MFAIGTLHANGKRKDVDKEFVMYVDVTHESLSFFFQESIQKCGQPAVCQSRAVRILVQLIVRRDIFCYDCLYM